MVNAHFSHELYNSEDFTAEEYKRRNIIAVYVMDFDVGICKKCGKTERALINRCSADAHKHLNK